VLPPPPCSLRSHARSLARRYLDDGRIKNLGFSTHGPTASICKLIATDKFDYVNLHYHWCGSYTASGHAPTEADCGHGNESAVKMCRVRQMGVFCISPVDKGGGVHNASYKLRGMTEAQGMDPVEYSVAWTIGRHDTQTIGCARPEDLDEVFLAATKSADADYRARVEAVESSVTAALDAVHGAAWAKVRPPAKRAQRRGVLLRRKRAESRAGGGTRESSAASVAKESPPAAEAGRISGCRGETPRTPLQPASWC
jgi:predicted aldo/keto reductase-like oxidoreductase